MVITLRQLDVFVSVAKFESVSEAARALKLSQPAVSMSVSHLEDVLGERVFDRVDRHLFLNDRGRSLLPLAAELCSRAREIEVTHNHNISLTEYVGSLQVGASSTIGNYLLPIIVGDFVRRYPKTGITLESSNTEKVLQDLKSFKIDIAFIEGISVVKELQAFPWRHDKLSIVAPPNHPFAKSPPKNIEELLSEPHWIMRERGSGTRKIFENALTENLHDLKVYLELGHTEAIKTAVANGLGISSLSVVAVKHMLDHGDLVEVETPFMNLKRTFYIVIHRDKYRSRLMSAFLRFCEKWEDIKQ